MPPSSIVVVGSLNIDLTLSISHLSTPGETQLARGFTRAPGGKGANQAVAAARLGAPTSMIGCVGADDAGSLLLSELQQASVDISAVAQGDEPTGTALVLITPAGENSILVASSANGTLSVAHLQAHRDRIALPAWC